MRKQIALSHAARDRRHQEEYLVDFSYFENFEPSLVYGTVGGSRGFGGNSLLCWARSIRQDTGSVAPNRLNSVRVKYSSRAKIRSTVD